MTDETTTDAGYAARPRAPVPSLSSGYVLPESSWMEKLGTVMSPDPLLTALSRIRKNRFRCGALASVSADRGPVGAGRPARIESLVGFAQ